MADPTPEELQQQIDELKSLITTQYEPPTGNEYSYPVVNQPVNDEMWQYITLGFGNGILDEGGQPYWLRGRENVNNTLRITVSTTTGTAQGVVRGFYHKMNEDKTFTVPPVASKTTYHFCLTFDPAASTSPGGPVSLQMYAGTPPTTLGRFHVVLWSLTRSPNQLLTNAPYQRFRPKISPTLTVNNEADLPDVTKVLWGTRVLCHETQVEYRAAGSGDETDSPTHWLNAHASEWTNPGDTASYVWPGHGYRRGFRRVGDSLEFRGRIGRVGGASFVVGGGGNAAGYHLYNFGASNAPKQEQRFITSSSGWNSQRLSVITVTSDGNVYGMPVIADAPWMSLDGIRVSLRE
jgi:hypothetical protein